MASLKHILKHPRSQQLASIVLAFYIRLVYATSRKRFIIDPLAQPYMDGKENAIFAFWHGHMMLMPVITPPRPMHVLISHHSDGALISQVIARFNHHTVTGSSSRGGTAAVRSIMRLIMHGNNISITPDGPRGPHRHASIGVATIAALARKKVIPCTFSASRFMRLNSWDQFTLALPFGKIVFCIGVPIMVEGADETSRQTIEAAMNELVEKADALQQL